MLDVCLSTIKLGGMTCILALIQDVTARQNAKKEITGLQEQLGYYGRLNTAGELSTDLAHKLNYSLAATPNYIQFSVRRLVKIQSIPRDIFEALQRANELTLRAGVLTFWLREFVRNDTSGPIPTDTNTVIREIGALVFQWARRPEIEFVYNLDPDLDEVLINLTQLLQVIPNLVSNSMGSPMDSSPLIRTVWTETQNRREGAISIVISNSPHLAKRRRSDL